uniref:Molybdate transport system substrate-binding protein n=1 Tax=Candidatus Kentrum sp. TC TaxID=2126339 RepID=A0A450YMY8_9GAMM|nr:MAG: molybdate transport system substrate-binding protein [Candidatus Kentron sp. TC]
MMNRFITRGRRTGSAALLLALLFALRITPCLSSEGSVHIAVASNFAPTLRLLTASFRLQSPHRLKVSTASTGKLFAQIRHGAPFELFLSADAERPELLVAEGRAVPESLFTYAIGRLALWQPAGAEIASRDSEILGVTIGRLAIANPKTAPYGKAAEETLRALGLWGTWRTRLVRGENIGQTYQFVASGAVDSGFVALSQIPARNRRATKNENPGPSTERIRIVPSSLHASLRQRAVLLYRGANNAKAKEFLDFLRSREAREIIRAEGYGLPDS